ncbi:hypothetical protein ACIBK8_15310 [Streptomyces sp. NPDC050161]
MGTLLCRIAEMAHRSRVKSAAFLAQVFAQHSLSPVVAVNIPPVVR